MLLDDRKRKILRAIIDDYINTAEPIGSRSIAKKHELGLSSATIRNEMADLEELGLLSQPHTSAGRIPSDKGYRFYVDQLMKLRELSDGEIDVMRAAMEIKINELSQLIRQASSVMSHFTRYTSIAITPQIKKSTLKAVQVVPIDFGNVLVIVVTSAGTIRNSMIRIHEAVDPDYIIRASNIINDKLSGLMLGQIDDSIINEIKTKIGMPDNVLAPVLEWITDGIGQLDSPEIYMDGATNILNYPEFRDILKAKEFLDVLDAKDILHRMLTYSENSKGINVSIGSENSFDEIKDCSLITTTYSVNQKVIGSIGIIGPTRMEYPRVISSLVYIGKKIDEEIHKLLGEYFDDS